MTICAVEGCDRAVRTRGWCGPHYWRWLQHGVPTLGRTTRGNCVAFVDKATQWRESECLLWPYTKQWKGYGQVRYDGRLRGAHQVVCEIVHGARPSSRHQAAHSCGERACVNPAHLRWATGKDNQADRVVHDTHLRGERHPKAKLTAEHVARIRNCNQERQSCLAAELKVSQSLISLIRHQKRWQHVGILS